MTKSKFLFFESSAEMHLIFSDLENYANDAYDKLLRSYRVGCISEQCIRSGQWQAAYNTVIYILSAESDMDAPQYISYLFTMESLSRQRSSSLISDGSEIEKVCEAFGRWMTYASLKDRAFHILHNMQAAPSSAGSDQ